MSYATMQAPCDPGLTADEKTYAGLSHALMISTAWIAPLIFYFMKKDSRFVRFHAMQALLWQVVFSVVYFVAMAVLVAVVLSSMLANQGKALEAGHFPVALFVAMPFLWLLAIGGYAVSLTLAIMFSLKAMRGQWAEYPVIGKWALRIVGS